MEGVKVMGGVVMIYLGCSGRGKDNGWCIEGYGV